MAKHSNLREYFERGSETQSAFAERMGIDGGYLSRLITGERVPSLGVAVRIAKAARIPITSLLPTDPDGPNLDELVEDIKDLRRRDRRAASSTAPVDASDSSSADDAA